MELVHLAQVCFSKCGAITTDTGVIFNNLECITSISLPSILLPTDLVSFSAVTNNYHVELGWQTASEVNNDFNLKISNNIEKILITVYDLFGKEIFAKQIVTNTNSRSVYTIYSSQKLNAGIYLITVDVDK